MAAKLPKTTAPSAPDEAGDRQFITALARGLRVLQAFGVGDDRLTNVELARRTGLPKPTISRLTHTLSRLGYLAPAAVGEGYSLQPHILTLGYPVLAGVGVRQIIRPHLQALARAEGATAAMALRDGVHMIFVERVRGEAATLLTQDVGTRVPVAVTAIGRGYLAGLPVPERAALLNELRASGLPEWWPQLQAGVEREMARFAAKGYCFGGDWTAELTGVGVPLRLPDGRLAAIACTGSRKHFTERRLAAAGERLKDIVAGMAKLPDGDDI